jgi:hypothetical protein
MAVDRTTVLGIHRQVDRLRKYSDRVIGIGPFGVGLDGVLAWVPVAGTVYSAGAGAWLIAQAVRAGASPFTIARMVGYLGLDTVSSATPIAGQLVDFLFPGHLMAARALLKDIERRHPDAKGATSPVPRVKRLWPGRGTPADDSIKA